jgi:hypothetical protein
MVNNYKGCPVYEAQCISPNVSCDIKTLAGGWALLKYSSQRKLWSWYIHWNVHSCHALMRTLRRKLNKHPLLTVTSVPKPLSHLCDFLTRSTMRRKLNKHPLLTVTSVPKPLSHLWHDLLGHQNLGQSWISVLRSILLRNHSWAFLVDRHTRTEVLSG